MVSCWPDGYTLQIWSEKILMFDGCIFILLFNAFCQWNNLYLPFLTLILWWKTRDVCSGSCALKEWNTEISVTLSGILWRVKLDFEVLFIYLFLRISQTYGVSWGKVALKGMGTSMCDGQSYFTGLLWGSKTSACWIWTTSFQPFFYSRACKDDYILPAS